MVRLEDVLLPDQDVFSDMSDTIRWIARNSTKPGRSSRGENLVIHASQNWSRELEDIEPGAVAEELWNEVSHLLRLPPVRPAVMTAHLWKHRDCRSAALVRPTSSPRTIGLGSAAIGVVAAAEHAFDSGTALGKAIVDAIT